MTGFSRAAGRPFTTGPHDQGQAVVELAVTLPILLLLIVGLINLGMLVNAQIILTQAAWEGARAGATLVNPSRGDDEIIGAVRQAVIGLDPNTVQIDIVPRQDESPRNQPWPEPRGRPLTVHLAYRLTLALPLIVDVPVHAEAVSRMEYQNP